MPTPGGDRLQATPGPQSGREQAASRLGSPPVALTSLIGRDVEIASVRDLLRREEVRLVTLTGPGGVGKTRLALKVSEVDASAFPDGVWFVALATFRDPRLVASAIGQALGVRDSSQVPIGERITAFLHDQRALLVLDNFEHVIEAAPGVSDLLVGCPGLKILATSREPLRLSGEHEFPVPPLSLPGSVPVVTADRAGWSEAVRLFVARARAVRPDFGLNDDIAADVEAICRRLDGLPLAIELAAARARHLPPAALRAQLEQGLPLLAGGPRDAPARHQTLRDAISWSYDLLRPEEQALFQRLAVFVGGFPVTAVEHVAFGRGEEEARINPASFRLASPSVLDAVTSLADKNLLRVDDWSSDVPRFSMLETVREYAVELLEASGELEAAQRRHANWCFDLAWQSHEALMRRTEVVRWLNRIEIDYGNMRAALAWAERFGGAAGGLRLAGSLWPFWYFHSHLIEGSGWLRRMLDRSEDAPAAVRGDALIGAGTLAHYLGDDGWAVPALDEGLVLCREVGETRLAAFGTYMLGVVAEDQGRYADAVPRFQEGHILFRASGDEVFAALTRYHLGVVAYGLGDPQGAVGLLEDASTRLGQLGDQWSTAVALDYLGYVAADLGDLDRAAECFAATLPLHRTIGSREIFVSWLSGVATLAALHGRMTQAAELFSAADAMCRLVGYVESLPERALFERMREFIRTRLSKERFAEAWAEGQALNSAQAMDAAVEILAPVQLSATAAASCEVSVGGALTPRELDVLRLLAAGRTDREIGEALFISPRTASKHVASILAKLGVGTRGEAAVRAVRDGLV